MQLDCWRAGGRGDHSSRLASTGLEQPCCLRDDSVSLDIRWSVLPSSDRRRARWLRLRRNCNTLVLRPHWQTLHWTSVLRGLR